MIQAVIFDMDGVLVDSYAPHLESWRMLAREFGADITETQFAETFGRRSPDIIRLLFGVTDGERAREMDARKEALYREIIRGRVPEMAGATELLKTLDARGLRLAVGTSGPRENIDVVCDELDWNGLLRVQVTGADVTRGKPDPEVFLTAADRLAVAAESCVVVEDAPAGVEAAKRGGMRCIALASTHAEGALAQADHVAASLAETAAVLESWQGANAG